MTMVTSVSLSIVGLNFAPTRWYSLIHTVPWIRKACSTRRLGPRLQVSEHHVLFMARSSSCITPTSSWIKISSLIPLLVVLRIFSDEFLYSTMADLGTPSWLCNRSLISPYLYWHSFSVFLNNTISPTVNFLSPLCHFCCCINLSTYSISRHLNHTLKVSLSALVVISTGSTGLRSLLRPNSNLFGVNRSRLPISTLVFISPMGKSLMQFAISAHKFSHSIVDSLYPCKELSNDSRMWRIFLSTLPCIEFNAIFWIQFPLNILEFQAHLSTPLQQLTSFIRQHYLWKSGSTAESFKTKNEGSNCLVFH